MFFRSELLDRFSKTGGELLVKTLDGLADGSIRPRPQDPQKATFAPMLEKGRGQINFLQDDAWTIHNQVRGLFPWPGAYGFIQKKRVKILRTRLAANQEVRGGPGSFQLEGDRLFVSCKSDSLEILELQPEGKKALKPKEFMNGMRGTEPPFMFDPVGE